MTEQNVEKVSLVEGVRAEYVETAKKRPAIRLISTSDAEYVYRLHGKLEMLPLRPNHYYGGGGVSSLSYPQVTGRGRRRITYVYNGTTWVSLYRRNADGCFELTASYGTADAPQGQQVSDGQPLSLLSVSYPRDDYADTLATEDEVRAEQRRDDGQGPG